MQYLTTNGNWKQVAGIFRMLLNLFIASVLTVMFTEWREFKKDIKANMEQLEAANAAQDAMSTTIRMQGFERLKEVETIVKEHEKRLDSHDGQIRRGPTLKSQTEKDADEGR